MNALVKRFPAALDLAAVFGGRLGGILVNLLFIPAYARYLDADSFGWVSLVLSAQSFFLIADFGLATVLARDVAAAVGRPEALAAAHDDRLRAELLIFVVGTCPGVLALIIAATDQSLIPFSAVLPIAAAGLVVACAIGMNIVQLSLNAVGRYRSSAMIAVVGTLTRAIATLTAIILIAPTFLTFILAQSLCLAAQLFIVRIILARATKLERRGAKVFDSSALRALMVRAAPAGLFAIAAAAAINLDKPIVSSFVSVKAAGHYFLATTYAMVPIGLLSGPISQYFSPIITRAELSGDRDRRHIVAVNFQTLLMLATVIPTLILAVHADAFIHFWLPPSVPRDQITSLALPLTIANAFGALGYYPSTALIALQELRFLARMGLATTALLLIALCVCASQGSLTAMAISFAIFYLISTILAWAKLSQIWSGADMQSFLVKHVAGPLLVFGVILIFANWIAQTVDDPIGRAITAAVIGMMIAVPLSLGYIILINGPRRHGIANLANDGS